MAELEYVPVDMLWDDLSEVPQYPLPEGYSMRLFVDGDADTWVTVEKAAEPFIQDMSRRIFDREFSNNLPAMLKRCYFLVSPDGRDVGTVTAWYDRMFAGKRWGRVHWVAIIPEFQGLKLCKPMLTVAMNRLRSLGHRRATLNTQLPRIAAIKNYLDFGFRPDVRTARAKSAWRHLGEVLPHPLVDEALKGSLQ